MLELNPKRVLVGLSGGVDSSATAALLKEQGYDVIGITLKLWPQDCASRAEDKCCGPQAVADARSICHTLAIPFYLIDEAQDFKKEVTDYFVREYKAGRTPNPCVLCNERLKFGSLLRRADQLGAQYIATGHYARIEWSSEHGRFLLKRGADRAKDQSYFLFSLKQHQLGRSLMPLGAMTKTETRSKAHKEGLKTAEKEESMEICFVPDNDYGSFLVNSGGVTKHPGAIVNLAGEKLGAHDGIEFFTIGQRKGLGISSKHPLYVIDIDPERNEVVVGPDSALERQECTVDRCNWIPFEHPPAELSATVQIRYRHRGAEAVIRPVSDGSVRVLFNTPQRAITPGQACVFYQGDLVLGGGWIVEALK